jgi:protease-4
MRHGAGIARRGDTHVKLVRGAWKILVGIKDGLVLLLMLIFFGALFAALSATPNRGAIRDGALVLKLDGAIVEQPATPTAFAAAQGQGPAREFRLRDLVRAIDTAKDDARVKVLVLDLDSYGGGYPAAVTEVANAIGRFKTSGKKVLAYATAYTDGSYLLASNASEIWVDPMGGTLFTGPGGNQLYYKGLIDKLGVNVHVYRVGKFKSYVEPYTRADQSPEAKEASTALYGTIFGQWKEFIHKARPKAQIDAFLTQPDVAITAAQGDIARANLNAGLVDRRWSCGSIPLAVRHWHRRRSGSRCWRPRRRSCRSSCRWAGLPHRAGIGCRRRAT